ncbi:MAG: PKD domain-containing protein, partial [Deltaproteobacteria bacterium]|nr:PKD domain-containing protein [Deltaproteobacteria bacterium]
DLVSIQTKIYDIFDDVSVGQVIVDPVLTELVDIDAVRDTDKDGVPDVSDLCPGTPRDVTVDENGCPDTAAPDTSITSGPSGLISGNDAVFTYTGTDDKTSTSNLQFSYILEGYSSTWSGYSSYSTTSYNYLPNGEYTFKVKARDESGNVDGTPAEQSFTIGTIEARFTATPVSGIAPLSVQFTDQSRGDVAFWWWDFGDGTTSTDRNPVHTYTTGGTYSITLVVVNQLKSDSETKQGYITVCSTSADFTATPLRGSAPLIVDFTDTSTGATSWLWNFGDGSISAARNTKHTYTANGTYTVTLTVTGACGSSTKTGTIRVCDSTTANFTTSTTNGYVPLNVSFTDSSSGAITSRSWSFGDGGTSTAQNPAHTYAGAGTYIVTLTVTGPCETSTMTATITVIEPVAADFIAGTVSGEAPLSVTFSNRSTGAITSWLWNFGDGTTASTISPTHVYKNPGTYTVSLMASGPDGTDTETKTNLITVKLTNCECDLNTDGSCNMRDWVLFGKRWGSTNCNSSGIICECDLNHDGSCNMRDWVLFGQNWGQTVCPRAPWSMFMHDRQHTGRSSFAGSQTNNLKWIFSIGANSYVSSSPVIGADGTVYVGGNDYVFAIDSTTGSQKWLFNPYNGGYDFSGSPAIGTDGTVYGISGSNVYALDWMTGKRKWQFSPGNAENSPTIGVDGTVYIGDNSGVYAINCTTGTPKWVYIEGGAMRGSPALGLDGTVYIGSSDYKVYALDGTTGTPIWTFSTGKWIEGSPSIGHDGTVYIGSDDYNVYALDGATGDLKWSYTTGGMVTCTPAIGNDGTIYVGSWDGKIYALNGLTGSLIWSFATGSSIASSPAIGADGTLYVGSFDHKIYALDGATGNQRWVYTTGCLISSSPAIGSDGTVYVGSYDGYIYAFGQ